VGDTTPNLPTPPPPAQDDGGCGALGSIIMIIVVVVVSFYTAGAAAGMLGSSFGAAAGTAGAVTIGTTTLTAGGAFLAGAIGGAVGSIAGQAVGMAIGAQDEFSWTGVALGALSGGFAKGLNGVDFTGSGALDSTGNVIARAAVGSALTQGVAVATGLQRSFDWRGVAASAVGAGVGQAVGGAMGMNDKGFGDLSFGEQFGARLVTGLAAGTATAIARGGRIAVQQIATDAFGNALGDSLAAVNGPRFDSVPGQVSTAERAQILGDFAGGPGSGSHDSSIGDDPVVAMNPGEGGASQPARSFAEDVAARKAGNNPMGLPTGGRDDPGYTAGRIKGSVSATLRGDNLLMGEFRRLNPGVDINNVRADRDYIIPTSVADRDVANANFQAVAKGWKADAVAADLAAQRRYIDRNDAQLRSWVDDQFATGKLDAIAAMTPSYEADSVGAKLLNDKNLMKADTRSAYRTDSGYRDTKSGQYTKSPWTNPGDSKSLSMESEYVLYGGKTSGAIFDALPIDNENYIGPHPYADYQGEGKVVLTGKNSFIPGSLDAKLSGGARAGVRWAQGAAEGSTDALGATFGAKFEGNLATSAAAGAEAKVSFKRGGPSGVTTDVGLTASADAALLRAQGKGEVSMQFGPLTLKPSVQAEGQAFAIGATGGAGFRTYETRTGGSMYISGGASMGLGAKAKFGLDWGWKN
jgi:hypothetical protein